MEHNHIDVTSAYNYVHHKKSNLIFCTYNSILLLCNIVFFYFLVIERIISFSYLLRKNPVNHRKAPVLK